MIVETPLHQAASNSISKAQTWIDRTSPSGLASLDGLSPPSLLPTCFSIISRECMGKSRANSTEITNSTAEWIQSHQDITTGLFSPGSIRRPDLTSHSATYILLQSTYFALHALDALNCKPKHKIQFVNEISNTAYLKGWLDGGPWQSPWLHSNNIMFALSFLQHEGSEYNNSAAMNAFDFILDYLDNRQDIHTGLWQPDDDPDIPNSVFAAYHFFPFYFWRGRELHFIEKIIDSTLSIQHHHGLFTFRGGACEDLDAVHTLCMMTALTNHRRDEISIALKKCFWKIIEIQNEDGGFPNAYTTNKPNQGIAKWIKNMPSHLCNRYIKSTTVEPPKWYYSGWKRISCNIGASDTWSAWFRPLALKLISDTLEKDILKTEHTGHYRRLPGLGWHDSSKIRTCTANLPTKTTTSRES